MRYWIIKINTFLTPFAQKQKGFIGTIWNFIEQMQKAEGVGISMLPKPSALAISSPEGILLPDSDLITECDNTNVFVVII